MYTQCPNCRTIFQIDEDALQASLGIVRCGHCSERFDALRTLTDTLPADPASLLPEHDPAARTPTLTEFVATEAGITARPTADTMDAAAAAAGVEAWIAPQAAERARALIADAAGIPPDAIAGDPAWQVLDIPVQAKLIEQDFDIAPAAETLIPEPAIEAAMPTAAEPMTAAWEVGTDFADAGETAVVTVMADDTAPTAATEADATDAIAAEWEVTAPEGAKPDLPLPAADATAALDEPEAGADGDAIAGDAEAEPGAAAAPEAAAASTAEPVYVPPHRRALRDRLWIAGCVLLTLVLIGQLGWAQRSELVRDPATRAWTLGVCSHIDCRLPPIRSVAQLELMSRDIRHDPDRANALLITATVRNNAPFRQPWPVVVVRMTDIDDNVVAMRRFLPADYLHNAARRRTGLAPGATAAVAFAVADPGKRATGFRFNFE